MPREPGPHWLSLAREVVMVCELADPEADPEIERRAQAGWRVCTVLTPVEALDKEFPQAQQGSLYNLFATATQEVKVMVVVGCVAEDGERAFREAALGMLDNSHCVYR